MMAPPVRTHFCYYDLIESASQLITFFFLLFRNGLSPITSTDFLLAPGDISNDQLNIRDFSFLNNQDDTSAVPFHCLRFSHFPLAFSDIMILIFH